MTSPASTLVETPPASSTGTTCRHCGNGLQHTFVDLGMSPLCESFLPAADLDSMEPFFPLHAFVCDRCFLVQVGQYVTPEHIFTEYAYFSSYATSWLAHAKRYTEQMIDRFGLTERHKVVELASNDGYLLQYFVQRGIPSLGIEPAANVAEAARARGVETLVKFFGQQTAEELVAEGLQADLLLGNNVLAQVPDVNDFVAGMKTLLRPGGVITMEFPHLSRQVEGNQFDQVYHEHFSYFSFLTAERIFAAQGLTLFDVEELPTHGGSIRIFGCHTGDTSHPVGPRVEEMRARELAEGVTTLEFYSAFSEQVQATKRALLRFLIDAKAQGLRVAGYGAPGKGNTLLNYCGIRTDFLDYTVDRNPYKHGRFTPGTHIPIFSPEKIQETKPDFLLILPWNFKDEIMQQMAYVREWGCKFVVPIPTLTVYP
jgi:SAM-dependent methyltransferase